MNSLDSNVKVLLGTAVIVGLVIGFYISRAWQPGMSLAEQADLKSKIDRVQKIFPPLNDVRALSGIIKSIAGNTITIENVQIGSPLEVTPSVRTVTVTNETKIVRQEIKDPAVLQKEALEFQKSPAGKASPTPFIETVIPLSTLKVGDQIIVSAAENIKTAENFAATSIVLPPPSPTQPDQPTLR